MKYCFVIAALAVLHAQGQVPRMADGHPDLGSGGVWLPAHLADLAPNVSVPFQGWVEGEISSERIDEAERFGCALPAARRSTHYAYGSAFRNCANAAANLIYV
jgi:hypothetical protein